MDKNNVWDKINNMEDYFITYLLYKEGKNLNTIAKIRGMNLNVIENHIIKAKMALPTKGFKSDFLVELISLPKEERIKVLNNMTEDEKENLSNDIYKRYVHFKNSEDRMILIWLIGELKYERLLPFLKMELLSNKVNHRRLSCSALGKIGNKNTKPWLENVLNDSNPQVRQYAVKSLSKIGDTNTLPLLQKLALNDEKEYVRKAAVNSINEIEKF